MDVRQTLLSLRNSLSRISKFLLAQSVLIAGAIIVPVTYLVIAASIKTETEKWTLQLYTPPIFGFASIYLANDNRFIPLHAINTYSTVNGKFCSTFECPQLDHADLRILVPGQTPCSQSVTVAAQFVSFDGDTKVALPVISVPTYSIRLLHLRNKDDRMGPSNLPRLSKDFFTLPPQQGRTGRLYWLLLIACVVTAILYSFSFKTQAGFSDGLHMLAPSFRIISQILLYRNLFTILLGLNAALFCIACAVFAQRYQADDDPAMAMIACGTLTGHPSEYLVYINFIIGLALKCLYLKCPSLNWYFLFLATTMIGSSAIIGSSLLNRHGLRSGGSVYVVATLFYIFQAFCGLQYTIAAAFTCLAGLAVVLAYNEAKRSLRCPVMIASIFLMALGSLIRYESALLVIALIIVPLLLVGIIERRYIYIAFIFISFLSIQGLHYCNKFYYCSSPDWKEFFEYNKHFGHLAQMPRFDRFKDNREVYESIGWNKNDFDMISWQWLYQDPKVFSLRDLSYLDEHLITPLRTGFSIFALLRPIWYLFGMPLVLFVYILYALKYRSLSPALVVGILAPLVFVLVYLSVTAHLPDRVFISALFTSFLLTVLLSKVRLHSDHNSKFLDIYIGSICLFVFVCSLLSLWHGAEINIIKTKELKESLIKIAYLQDKVFLSSISSIGYEYLPPCESWTQFKNIRFIDIMWTYPSPDVLSAFHQNGIDIPFVDLAKGGKTLLLVPTFAWDRGLAVQQFLHDHYNLNVNYEVVKDSNGGLCCYTNFTVLRYFLLNSRKGLPPMTNKAPLK